MHPMQMSVNFRGKGKKDESTFYEANEITRVTWKARQMPDPKKLKMKQQKKNRYKHKGQMQAPPICYLNYMIPPCKCPPTLLYSVTNHPIARALLILPIFAYMKPLQVMHQVKFVPILGLVLFMIICIAAEKFST